MARIDLLPDWRGEDVYIIGGGHSLRSFDFKQLIGLNTIGCNQAFLLGADICNICSFGDKNFWDAFEHDLPAYEGWVVTCQRTITRPLWLNYYPRQMYGLGLRELGWNGNTGAMSINLALMLGAKRVCLLGMDLRLGTLAHKSHWHDYTIEVPKEEIYAKFHAGFYAVKTALAETYPGTEVINIHNGGSDLKAFPVCSFEEMGLVAPPKAKLVV